jgi:Flp pilus assembly protein CpaB
MTSQLRLVIVIVIVVIIIAVVGILVVPGVLNQGGTTTGSTTTGGSTRPTVGPSPTPVDTEVPIEYIELVMSSQKIPRGFIIPPNAVLLSKWPLDPAVKLPEGIMQNLDDVINKRARTDIFRGQPILADYLVEDLANLASVGSDAAAILPTNRVAVAVPMDRITSVAYQLKQVIMLT